MKRSLTMIITSIFISCSTGVERYYDLKEIRPEMVGFNGNSLKKIDDLILRSITNKEVSGTTAIVIKDGGIVYHKAFGLSDIQDSMTMKKNTIMAIASMSKLMTTVGALILYDRGEFDMNTRLDEILPEFKDPKVFISYDKDLGSFSLKGSSRPILMKHLFTHTSGIVYPIFQPDSLGRQGYIAAGVQDAWPDISITLEENIKRLATLPLNNEPGEKWHYGLNMDVLGRVIEVLDGRPFARFMKEELFHPLELKDTGFSLPEEKWERVAKIYDPRDEQISEFMCCPEYTDDEMERIGRKRFPIRSYKQNTNIIAMGGADIFSTAYDYARFLQMLVNKGSLNGKRILGRRTVAMINRPLEHLFMPEDTNIAMGLGVGVVKDENSSYEPHSSGSYWWGGYFFTSFWVDPEEGLIGVIMNQVNPTTSKLVDRFHQLVYSALGE